MRICIVGAGPSIWETTDELKALVADGAHVAVVNHAHDWAVKQGINPNWAFLLESSHLYKIQNAVPGCTYLIRKDAVEHVRKSVDGGKVQTFAYGEDKKITVRGMGALNLAYLRGYREFHLFGFDACVKNGGTSHFDGTHERSVNDTTRYFVVGDRVFRTNKIWRHQCFALLQLLTGPLANTVEVKLYGDGLLAALAEMIRNDQSLPPEGQSNGEGVYLKKGIEAWYTVNGDRYTVYTRPATEAEAKQYVHGIRKGKDL